MRSAALIISHAGAGSILEGMRLRAIMVVVVNDALMHNHQQELAGELLMQRRGQAEHPIEALAPLHLGAQLGHGEHQGRVGPGLDRGEADQGALGVIVGDEDELVMEGEAGLADDLGGGDAAEAELEHLVVRHRPRQLGQGAAARQVEGPGRGAQKGVRVAVVDDRRLVHQPLGLGLVQAGEGRRLPARELEGQREGRGQILVQQRDELAPAEAPADAVPVGEAGLGEARRPDAPRALKAGDGAEGPKDARVWCHRAAAITRRGRLGWAGLGAGDSGAGEAKGVAVGVAVGVAAFVYS
jgi:ribosomal protein L27